MKKITFFIWILFLVLPEISFAQKDTTLLKEIKSLKKQIENNNHTFDQILKNIDDVLWFERVGDVAFIDKVRIASTPRWKPRTPDDRFAKNKLQFYSYVFIPRNINTAKKYPLIVLPHGGVHADFTTYHTHIVREMLAQGYVVIAPEYRGSTGYGQTTYENIDYGGRENDDVLASRDYMVENYNFIDKNKVGVVGWSHGGMIALMQILLHPEAYQCAFAGVPVSDLHNRLASHDKDYTEIYSADYFIGKTPEQNPQEYIRRSPTHYARNLNKPLLIHTNTNDNDVYVEEVKLMIDSLKFYDKKFEYKIFEKSSGGHGFDRIDMKEATDIRFTIYKFLEKYLHPPKPFKSASDMRKAGYRFN
ncbi:conserved hypothetical protein [uncultured Paludibacter sp.]|uniref:Peptidase S9 prolyl oligopeptidase catalytic domain-containing protein n=1 Tax=uncultured Paludibacter sp. TaxID=497635 RepID=A0A653AJC4_9BACT|nr:conserved hypothetical protein [uncultured Paludibacter sp.]